MSNCEKTEICLFVHIITIHNDLLFFHKDTAFAFRFSLKKTVQPLLTESFSMSTTYLKTCTRQIEPTFTSQGRRPQSGIGRTTFSYLSKKIKML